MSWASELTIQGRTGALEALEPVASYTHQKPWESLEGITLPGTLAECVARDPWPLPPVPDREGYYGERHFDFWISGLKDYCQVQAGLERHDSALKPGDSVFDWGCASGRVLRHFLCQSQGLDLWGGDINARSIDWALRFLGPSLRLFQCSAFPSLPLEDNTFSLVYAFSVFTHIADLEVAFLLELRRKLRRGGIAYLTIVTDYTWRNMTPRWPVRARIMGLRISETGEVISPDSFGGDLPAPRITLVNSTLPVYNCVKFHSLEYIREVWGRYFDLLEIVHEASHFQDAVILRKS
jgi:SAM-dependent methyltransferase